MRIFFVIFLLLAQTLAAQTVLPDHLWSAGTAKLLWGDTKAVVSSPLHWDKADWNTFGVAAVSIGTAACLDQRIRTSVQAHRTAAEDNFMARFQNLGANYSLAIMGGFELWGEVGGNSKSKRVAMDAVISDLIGPVLLTTTVKYTVWRARPYSTKEAFEFKPFGRDNQSFPSGHTCSAFSLATVIAEHYPSWWMQVICYGSASVVGYARIEQNAHFTSDVVAGGFLGWSVARAVVRRHDKIDNPNRPMVIPYANNQGAGVVYIRSF